MKSFQELINESLVPKPRERSGRYNPSSFGMCYRQQYWNRKDEPKSNPLDERNLRVFKCGNIFEEFVVGLLPKEGYQFQVKVETEDILGYADIVRENEVTDIKSQHSKSFWWMLKSKDIKKDKYNNWLQVMFYAYQLNKQFGRLVFISKDDLCIQEYVEPLEGYWQTQVLNEVETLETIWDLQELPPALPRCDKTKKGTYWQCEYCGWKDKCDKIEGKYEYCGKDAVEIVSENYNYLKD